MVTPLLPTLDSLALTPQTTDPMVFLQPASERPWPAPVLPEVHAWPEYPCPKTPTPLSVSPERDWLRLSIGVGASSYTRKLGSLPYRADGA